MVFFSARRFNIFWFSFVSDKSIKNVILCKSQWFHSIIISCPYYHFTTQEAQVILDFPLSILHRKLVWTVKWTKMNLVHFTWTLIWMEFHFLTKKNLNWTNYTQLWKGQFVREEKTQQNAPKYAILFIEKENLRSFFSFFISSNSTFLPYEMPWSMST